MKFLVILTCLVVLAGACSEHQKPAAPKDNKVSLQRDTMNVVKLSDTLVIWESTCRGCAYEGSTHFDVTDSLGLIELSSIRTFDDNPSDMSGGNVSKQLILVPRKTGTTRIRLYKFWKEQPTAEDSARFTTYSLDIRN